MKTCAGFKEASIPMERFLKSLNNPDDHFILHRMKMCCILYNVMKATSLMSYVGYNIPFTYDIYLLLLNNLVIIEVDVQICILLKCLFMVEMH